jgi:hypothetical protein
VARARCAPDGTGWRSSSATVQCAGWWTTTPDGELRSLHRFHGEAGGRRYAVVERILVPEGGEFLLIDRRTGRVTPVDGPPAVSPDGRHFATASLDLVAGHAPNRIRIYRVDERGPTVEWEVEPREWGARDPVWADPATLHLERGVIDRNGIVVRHSPMVLRRVGRGWQPEPCAAHAADAVVSFLSALGRGAYPEAAVLYGGSYERRRGWNPELDPVDLPRLWEAGCTRNGLQCLGRMEVLHTEEPAPGDYRVAVRSRTDGGETLVQGPCCGATPEEMPPRSEFSFAVRREGFRYLVQDLPVYVP